jgi:hypothetical protein
MVAVLMILAATKASAACDPNLDPGRCFEKNGYQLETVPLQGPFPTTDSQGNSVYTYRITKSTAIKRFKEVDILIPVCTPSLGNPISYSCSTPICVGKFYKGGSGDPSTGFGLGLTTDDTWNWNMFGERDSVTVSFTFQGKTYASQNALLVRVGLILRDYVYGQILAPSCGLVSAQVFPPQVPLATKKQEKISDIEVCIESTDQSGFPTLVYSCNVQGTPACDCSESDKDFWVKKPLSELQILPSTLQQVWIDPDPRSPATYIITSGSTCVKKCYPSGYCYVGPTGCTR